MWVIIQMVFILMFGLLRLIYLEMLVLLLMVCVMRVVNGLSCLIIVLIQVIWMYLI